MFDNATILVTGGTGSFGHDFTRLVLRKHRPREVIVFSRDEKKQHDMRLAIRDDRLSFVIGDIRDSEQIHAAMRGVDYVFHAAALKQVPSCEFFPMEAVRTNIIGTNNVLNAAEANQVDKLVVLSTDKAVYPINAMGQTKALMEKLMLARAKAPRTSVVFCGVRYGNVMYSRGSVIPLFVKQIKEGRPLTITHPDMTRLLLPLSQAVKLVTFAMEHGEPGDIFVRKAHAATVRDLAQATLSVFNAKNDIKYVGIREGEKMHEVLVTAEELSRAEEFDNYYRVANQRKRDYEGFFTRGSENMKYAQDGYTSANARQLSVAEVEALLLSLPEIQNEVCDYMTVPMPRRRAA
jgi:UDP-glucose 4-epimerase